MRKYPFVFCFMIGTVLFLTACSHQTTTRQKLAATILQDTSLAVVDSMARVTIRNGLNAGSGYTQVWARDMNTFVEIACEEMEQNVIREAIRLFFALQQPKLPARKWSRTSYGKRYDCFSPCNSPTEK